FSLCYVSLFVVDRVAPRFRGIGPEAELVQRYREIMGPHAGKVRLVVAAFFALVTGVGTSSHWNDYLMFRNANSFGLKDPQFNRDAGFVVFQLPFLKFVCDRLIVAMLS